MRVGMLRKQRLQHCPRLFSIALYRIHFRQVQIRLIKTRRHANGFFKCQLLLHPAGAFSDRALRDCLELRDNPARLQSLLQIS